MKYKKLIVLVGIILIVGVLAAARTYYSNSTNPPSVDDYGAMRDDYQKRLQTDDCFTWVETDWLIYNGIYTVKYPSCFKVESIRGGSIGSDGYETGIILKPISASSSNDYISIAGWQADCSNINVSGGENPSTKAFCLKTENGEKWDGEFITSLNEGKLFGIPVRTQSTNPKVLEMFDLIVENNKK